MSEESEIARLESRISELETMVIGLIAEKSENASDSYAGNYTDIPEQVLDIGVSDYGAFRWDGEKITHCYFQFGRGVFSIPDVQASGDGTYYLKVPHEYGGLNASIITTQESSDLTKTIIPLFKIEDGEITKDYRGMPVIPVRE